MKKFDYKVADADGNNVMDVLQEAGKEGFELVIGDMFVVDGKRHYHFVFKRGRG